VPAGLTGENSDVPGSSHPITAQHQEIPSFPDELERIIADIECRPLETLTPPQFALVEQLMEATRLLTKAELTLGGDLLTERKSA
jgi:hypothetical protein